jgi:hypothetical protein
MHAHAHVYPAAHFDFHPDGHYRANARINTDSRNTGETIHTTSTPVGTRGRSPDRDHYRTPGCHYRTNDCANIYGYTNTTNCNSTNYRAIRITNRTDRRDIDVMRIALSSNTPYKG